MDEHERLLREWVGTLMLIEVLYGQEAVIDLLPDLPRESE